MVAYSFQTRFVDPILAGAKQQTIRAERKRHARPGETMQLYTGMRTKQCRRIGEATCTSVWPITIDLRDHWIDFPMMGLRYTKAVDLDFFARIDGFSDWHEMLAFWRDAHGQIITFSGMLIRCRDLAP